MNDNEQQGTEPSVSRRRPRWQRWLVELALVLLVLAGLSWWQTRDAPRGPAPALAGALLDGTPVSLGSERDEPVLVYFWAEWCPVCGLQKGTIESLSREHRVISVATTSGSGGEVRAYMRANGLSFPVLVDEEGVLARAWGVSGVPAAFIIDREGQVAHALLGYTTWLGFRVRLWLAGR